MRNDVVDRDNSFRYFSKRIKGNNLYDFEGMYQTYLEWCDPRMPVITEDAFYHELMQYIARINPKRERPLLGDERKEK